MCDPTVCLQKRQWATSQSVPGDSSLLKMRMAFHFACTLSETHHSWSRDIDIGSPIRTYDNLGCTKYGVRPYDHGIVYDKGSQPEALHGESALGFSPICFEPSLHERIGKGARADYGSLTVVEHNAKVSFIGRILAEDWPVVPDAVDNCRARNKAQGSNNHEHQGEDKNSDRENNGQEPAPSCIGSGSTLVSSHSSERRGLKLHRAPKVHWLMTGSPDEVNM